MRGRHRSPKIRPASWDVSLIFDSEKEGTTTEKPTSKEEGEFSRKENGRLPVRKRPGHMEDGERERERERGESEGEGERGREREREITN